MVSQKSQKGRKKTGLDLALLYDGVFRSLVTDIAPPGSRLREFGVEKLVNRRAVPTCSYKGIGVGHAFKAWYQLETFHKRLIYKDDKSSDELAVECLSDFRSFQERSALIQPPARPFLGRVKRIVSDVLGEFDLHEFAPWCGFGKKAAQKLVRRDSFLDKRVETLNGTSDQLALFNFVRSQDVHLLRATRKGIKSFSVRNGVQIETVPKSYKAVRVIGLDTTIGGFLSKGLGNMIRHRVEANTFINLACQQDLHKQWAREASIGGHLATIDMSKASDSFTMEHLKVFLPESWHEVLRVVRADYWYSEANEMSGPLSSLMLMGSGHTFPLQTLLFYAIAKATMEEMSVKGIISVYGDDIILPNRCAEPFMGFATALGFSVNTDKSFWGKEEAFHIEKFRESCGGDFYAGVDVRPFQPECEMKEVSKNMYIAECHKILNGLVTRWHPAEVSATIEFVVAELARLCTVSFVPNTESETAGIRLFLLDWLAALPPKVNIPREIDGVLTYKALKPTGRTRVGCSRAHYWDWLRRRNGKRFKGYAVPGKDSHAVKSTVGTQFGREAERGGKTRYKWTTNPRC